MANFVRITLLLCTLFVGDASAAESKLSIELLRKDPHDAKSFTQGLFWQNGSLYESSGLYGKSYIARYRADTNQREITKRINPRLFAEGLTVFNDELLVLTWRAGILLILDPETFQLKRKLNYAGEGWGLTHNETQLIMSDGSETIRFRHPQDLTVQREIDVHNRWRKFKNINELEYAKSAIWANVWQTGNILQISPQDGRVLGIASLDNLVAENTRSGRRDVLNGIAYDSEQDAFWITGKFWPYRYLVRFNSEYSEDSDKDLSHNVRVRSSK